MFFSTVNGKAWFLFEVNQKKKKSVKTWLSRMLLCSLMMPLYCLWQGVDLDVKHFRNLGLYHQVFQLSTKQSSVILLRLVYFNFFFPLRVNSSLLGLIWCIKDFILLPNQEPSVLFFLVLLEMLCPFGLLESVVQTQQAYSHKNLIWTRSILDKQSQILHEAVKSSLCSHPPSLRTQIMAEDTKCCIIHH